MAYWPKGGTGQTKPLSSVTVGAEIAIQLENGATTVRVSQFVWLDYSEDERRKRLYIFDLFREHETRDELGATEKVENMPAYRQLKREGMDPCGLTQLASRTVGVPFVGLIAAWLAVSELLRRLHGGAALEFATGSVAALDDIEAGTINAATYESGHVPALVR